MSTSGASVQFLRASGKSAPKGLAGAIAGIVRERGQCEIQAIGAAAINQSVKAIAIARNFLELDGIDLVGYPAFTQVTIGEQEKTAMRFYLFSHEGVPTKRRV